ncbi:cytochrome c biogenesis protein CcmG, thiol:disulfide interchange protein DsbE [Pasteurella testudinis DSM 23072]|uniref:Cytochrome c biogenesis protein CcmG, thiol:disulfide interchange protein DsbE n=1 Tax=Pasteurella testudinis DSM 23072 TaxID=1122938 RepID=A0A1W1UNB8_9PAST|nr:DsbE family thiol:disulfide interchange protein [Pasteurella testudinis]SMB82570.1 cytochrome c biogenesis protein CcmG, thiol:disulfide interchange protein DsbE [Pasteurella testudinis DSM 23072]SUB52767.1 cytochrome c-type biogenesis/thiol:disulfide interchange protein CcmG [Pasteurella testudinis]
MNNKKLFLPLFAFLALVLVFAWQLMRNSAGEDPKALESALVGKPVPHFELPSLLTEQATQGNELFQQGKPLLLNVWATWCPTCYAEHQYLNQLAKQDITIIGINYKDKQDKAVQWLKNLGNPYQYNILDEKGMLGLDLGVYGAPETFLIDCKGIIRYRYAGDMNESVWQDRFKTLFEQLQGDSACNI